MKVCFTLVNLKILMALLGSVMLFTKWIDGLTQDLAHYVSRRTL